MPGCSRSDKPSQSKDANKLTGSCVENCSLYSYDCKKDPPQSINTPDDDYYKKRHEDFKRRHSVPPPSPPSYYLAYGDKYLRRFKALGPEDLSPAGLAWRDRTLKNLQDAIELKLREDPCAFDELESDDAAFQRFAYDSHVDAYINAGLYELPLQDLAKIGLTPDFDDIWTEDGRRQVKDVLKRIKFKDIFKILGESI